MDQPARPSRRALLLRLVTIGAGTGLLVAALLPEPSSQDRSSASQSGNAARNRPPHGWRLLAQLLWGERRDVN
jgi:hypothetical protein